MAAEVDLLLELAEFCVGQLKISTIFDRLQVELQEVDYVIPGGYFEKRRQR